MRVTIERSSGVATAVARGEFDAYEEPGLLAAFTDLAEDRAVVVDLENVSFMDSTALGVIVRGLREIEARGDDARVVLPAGPARRIFEITTLDRVLPVAGSRAEAVEALTARS